MNFNCKMGYSGNEQDYQLLKTSLSELKKSNNQKEVLRYLTNVLPNPTDIVTLDNAQDTVKSVKAQLANKNLIPYPYLNSTQTINGITFTVSSDGSITANGTATSNAYFEIAAVTTFYIPKGDYILSGCPSGGSLTTYSLVAVNGAGISYTKFRPDIGNGITLSSSGEYWTIRCQVMTGQTVENIVFKPQIELGTTATAYTPYISDFSTVKVKTYGKNLLPYPFTYETFESYGITFTDNKDGTITLNGRNDGTSISNYNLFNTSDKLSFLKPNTDYYLSCNLDNIIRSLRTVKPDGTYKYYTYGNINFPPDETPDRLFIQIKTTDTTTYNNTVVKLQIELGTTATDYEPYQGQTYTPTATGEATGIAVLNPTTNITNDKGLLFTKVVGDDFNYIN